MRRILLVTSIGLSACNSVTTPESGQPVPVIQALLTVGEHRHSINLTWSVPADSPFTFQGPARPVDPGEVSLRLVVPGGGSVPVVPTDPATGQFEMVADILPNAAYELQGSVAGRSVSASVVTPGPFFISLPAGDTVRLSNAGNPDRRVSYLWHANGAAGYSAKPFPATVSAASDSTGTIFFFVEPDTIPLTLLAFERHATEFILPSPIERRRGNIDGALGVLGAASTAKRVFIWQ